jgi:ribosomal protein S10
MASQVKIVDALKTEPLGPTGVQVPVKFDTTSINQALQKMVEQATKTAAASYAQSPTPPQSTTTNRINPSVYMRDIVTEMEKLYARFDRLKKLATEFHGLQVDTPVPDHVKIHSVTLKFSVTKNGETEECEAEIHNVPLVGDLSNLITTEFGFLISALKDYSAQMVDISTKTNERCGTALQDWEKQHNRRILSSGEAAVTTDAAADAAGVESSAATTPVTLGNA